MTTYAHAIAELGNADAAAMIYPLLAPYRGLLATTTISVWGLVEHALGRLELLLGEERRGRGSLTSAITRSRACRPRSGGHRRRSTWRPRWTRGVGEPPVDRLALVAEADRVARRHGAGLVLAAARDRDRVGDAGVELAVRIERLGLTRRQEEIVEAGGRRQEQPRDRRAAADQLQHGQAPPGEHLRPHRRAQPGRAGGATDGE